MALVEGFEVAVGVLLTLIEVWVKRKVWGPFVLRVLMWGRRSVCRPVWGRADDGVLTSGGDCSDSKLRVADRVGSAGSRRIGESDVFSLEVFVSVCVGGVSLGGTMGGVALGTAGRGKVGMGFGGS
jgi:hypothetical protein